MSTHDHHDHDHAEQQPPAGGLATAVLEMKGLHWATEKAIIEATLGRLEGVRAVDANPVPRVRARSASVERPRIQYHSN